MLTSHIRTIFSAAFTLAALTSATAQHPLSQGVFNANVSPPTLDHILTIELHLAPESKPIPVPSGIRIVQSILSGTVVGPGLNATIIGGGAFNEGNMTLEFPEINYFGSTDDGEPFFITQMGIGPPGNLISRVTMDIGGKYARFASSFIISVITLHADHVTATAEAWNATASTN